MSMQEGASDCLSALFYPSFCHIWQQQHAGLNRKPGPALGCPKKRNFCRIQGQYSGAKLVNLHPWSKKSCVFWDTLARPGLRGCLRSASRTSQSCSCIFIWSIYCGVPDPPCLSKINVILVSIMLTKGLVCLVRPVVRGFAGDPLSFARDNIFFQIAIDPWSISHFFHKLCQISIHWGKWDAVHYTTTCNNLMQCRVTPLSVV